jgi:hypothetical protein
MYWMYTIEGRTKFDLLIVLELSKVENGYRYSRAFLNLLEMDCQLDLGLNYLEVIWVLLEVNSKSLVLETYSWATMDKLAHLSDP